jgi:radical SAM superfamily enzyme YgiQ (UPF0313 family)
MGSRGCQYNCTFCTQSTLHELYDPITNFGYYRQRSPHNIIDEIEYQLKKYQKIQKFKGIIFYDDTFTSNRNFVFDFCREYIARGLNTRVHWAINARIENIDLELLKELRRAGCYYLYFGIESDSQNTRDLYKKKFDNKKIYETISLCKRLGFKIKTYFMIDGPLETIKDDLNTLKVLRELRPDSYHIMPFVPIANTKAAEILAKTNPKRYNYIFNIFNLNSKERVVDKVNIAFSIAIGHMKESYLQLLKFILTGMISRQPKRQMYARIIYLTMKDYFFMALKYGRSHFLIDLLRFLKLSIQYNFVMSDLFAFTLKKYILMASFQK